MKLHGLADRLINARAKGVAGEFFDLAEELDGQVFDLLESMEAVRDILARLTELYPESLVE